MAFALTPAQTPIRPASERVWPWALALAAAGLLAYTNTFSAPFIFDDIPAIADNPTIRDLRRPSELLAPPALRGSGAEGRPLVNLSLALNHAISGDAVWSYHAFNVLVHIAAGLALFGLVRRTFFGPLRGERDPLRSNPTLAAFAIALLWLVHPLQTESVTCIIQRTESLCGLFYLLAFYAFARAAEAGATGPRWQTACALACLAGAATKEVTATAPVLLLLYDRTFVAGSFAGARRLRGRLHAGLGLMTWLAVAALIWRSESRGGTVGFGHGVAWWEYALTQCRALVIYLKLTLWPHPLVLDYGTGLVRSPGAVAGQAGLIALLLAGTGWALVRRPVLGFCGAWFFVILAPSSSVVPLVTQTMAEHRMYLPLAAVVTLGVVGVATVLTRSCRSLLALAAVAFMAATFARNHDYRSAESIWEDNVAKWPSNPRGHYSLGQLADAAGRHDVAIAHGQAAVRLVPADATAQFNLAFALAKGGRLEAAVAHYREAARLRPESADASINLGAALVRLGRLDEAIASYETAVRLKPDSAAEHFNLAQALAAAGRTSEAIPRYQASLRLAPAAPETHYRLGHAWVKQQQLPAAVAAFRESARLAPDHFEAQVNLAGALLMLGRPAEAIPAYETALRLKPDDPIATANLARARAALR